MGAIQGTTPRDDDMFPPSLPTTAMLDMSPRGSVSEQPLCVVQYIVSSESARCFISIFPREDAFHCDFPVISSAAGRGVRAGRVGHSWGDEECIWQCCFASNSL